MQPEVQHREFQPALQQGPLLPLVQPHQLQPLQEYGPDPEPQGAFLFDGEGDGGDCLVNPFRNIEGGRVDVVDVPIGLGEGLVWDDEFIVQREGLAERDVVRQMKGGRDLQLIRREKRHITCDIAESPEPSEEEEVSNRLEVKDILNFLETLPERYRIAINLFVIEGYSHKEIADMLKIGESTSRSQLVKARKMLQLKIQQTIITLISMV